MWRSVKACPASQSSHSPFPTADAVINSLNVDIVQTKSFFAHLPVPPLAAPPDFLLICTAPACNCDRRRADNLLLAAGGAALRTVATWMCAKKCVVFCQPAVIRQLWFIYRVLNVTLAVFLCICAHDLFDSWGHWPANLMKRVKDTFSKELCAFRHLNQLWCSLIKNTNPAGPDLVCVVWLVVSGLVAPLSSRFCRHGHLRPPVKPQTLRLPGNHS